MALDFPPFLTSLVVRGAGSIVFLDFVADVEFAAFPFLAAGAVTPSSSLPRAISRFFALVLGHFPFCTVVSPPSIFFPKLPTSAIFSALTRVAVFVLDACESSVEGKTRFLTIGASSSVSPPSLYGMFVLELDLALWGISTSVRSSSVRVYINVRKVVTTIEHIPETSTSTTAFAGIDFALAFGFGFEFPSEVDRAVLVSRCLPFPFDVDLVLGGGFSVPESASAMKKSKDGAGEWKGEPTWSLFFAFCRPTAALRNRLCDCVG